LFARALSFLLIVFFFFYFFDLLYLHSFPTRRSSDLPCSLTYRSFYLYSILLSQFLFSETVHLHYYSLYNIIPSPYVPSYSSHFLRSALCQKQVKKSEQPHFCAYQQAQQSPDQKSVNQSVKSHNPNHELPSIQKPDP